MSGAGLAIPLLILGMALINLAIRWPVYLFADRFRFSPLIERALAFVPVAVLSAIVAPGVLAPGADKSLALAADNPFLWGAIAAFLVSWQSRRLMPTILVSMAVFLLARWALG